MKGLLRGLRSLLTFAVPVSGICAVIDPLSYLGVSVFRVQYLAVALSGLLAIVFLGNVEKDRGNSIKDALFLFLTAAILAGGLYVALFYRNLALTVGLVTPFRVVMGLITVIFVLEAARRTVGLPFVIIALVFICYALLASWFPGPLKTSKVPFSSLMIFLFLDPQGIYGIPFQIAATTVLCFIIFGRFVSAIGIGELFNDLAQSWMGKYRGGAAKVSVFSSSLFGMVSGSAVANVVTTGAFTIPTMIRNGYSPHFAAAVEAVSSTGGQIMPPVMGAAAFLMATFLGIPYHKIAISAFIPALLYYLAVFLQVDLRAGKIGLQGLPSETLPKAWTVLRAKWVLFIPVVLLVVLLFSGKNVEETGLLSSLGCIIVGLLAKGRTNFSLWSAIEALKDSSRVMIEVGITSAASGVIIGVLTITGLGYTFASILVDLAGGIKILLFLLAAITAVVLGMGMTVTAAYLLTVALAAPALIQVGVDPLVAHFFVFYYAVLSFLTPPVCLAVYAAAAIANSKIAATALNAIKLGVVAYIIPFVIAYDPALLLKGDLITILRSIAAAVIGVILLSVALEGFFSFSLSFWKRAIATCGGVLLFVPQLELNLLGLLFGSLIALKLITEKKRREK